MAEQPTVLQNVPFPEKLKTTGNLAANWKRFRRAWESYEVASRVKDQLAEVRAATLNACLGEDAQEVLDGLPFEEEAHRQDTDRILTAMQTYCLGETNETYERYIFFTRNQKQGEKIESYVATLRTLAKTCAFNDLEDSLIKDRIVTGISETATRKRLLTTDNLSLKKCVDICRSMETTEKQLQTMTGVKETDVHRVSAKTKPTNTYRDKKKSSNGNTHPSHSKTASHSSKQCLFCGGQHVFKKEMCPAWGKVCSKCKGKNHFASKCKASSRRVHAVQAGWEPGSNDDPPEYEEIDCVTIHQQVNSLNGKALHAEMMVAGSPVKFQLDTGASVNIVSIKHIGTAVVTPTSKTLLMWNKVQMKPLGEAKLLVHNPKTGNSYRVGFVVVKEDLYMNLLGAQAVQKMKLINVNNQNFKQVAAVNSSTPDVLEKYPDVFEDTIGQLPGIAHFKVDKSIAPTISPLHNVPISLRPELKAKLEQMCEQEIIEQVDQPTEWVSNIVITKKKNGQLRICLDPRPLNEALQRERYQLPVLNDVLPELAKAKVFSTLDLTAGYWHVTLDEESSLLTTFATPFGRYKWKRLPFGTNVSSELFQKRLQQAIGDLEGVLSIADDILVYGAGDDEEAAIRDHDMKLEKLLERCRQIGIRLNKEKMKLRQKQVAFVGHLLTNEGLKTDPEKVVAINNMPEPTDVLGVQRLCGMVNYLAAYLPKLADVLEPIRKLTHKDVDWNWSEEQAHAFQAIKEMVTNTPVLKYYDQDKPLTVQCDASQKGLGAALLQDGQPVAYASRALTPTEQRYAQIEKEMLAMVFALEKFNIYTYGRPVVVHTDHKPLETILRKPLIKAPKRLQAMMLRLQKYDISAMYLQGKHMYLADTLSRSFLPEKQGQEDGEDIEYIHMTQFLPISERRMTSIKEATEKDDTLQLLKRTIMDGWPEDKQLLSPLLGAYYPLRDELTVADGVILRGNRVVIPFGLRKTLKESIHSSHLGINGCQRRARECLYWPNMSTDIKDIVSQCSICRELETAQQRETLRSHDIPDRPWAKVGTDLFSLEGKDYLITVDYFSNFFEIDRLHDTTSTAVIRKLKGHFARYGIPETIVSDNGPQFSSAEFLHFSRMWDFEHCPSSPGNPRGNGKAESAVKTAKALMKKAQKSGNDTYVALLDHRNTPSQGHETSPAQSSLGRRTRSFLPMTQNLLKPTFGGMDTARKNINRQQQRQQLYYNRGTKDLKPLEEGDVVRMQPFVKGKHEWRKGIVNKRLDQRSYEVTDNNTTFRRNRAHLKKTNEEPPKEQQRDTRITKECVTPRPSPSKPSVHQPTAQQPSVHQPTVQQPSAHSQAIPQSSVQRDSESSSEQMVEQPKASQYTTRSGRTVKPPSRFSDS